MGDDATTFFAFSTSAFKAARGLLQAIRDGVTNSKSREAVSAAFSRLSAATEAHEPYAAQILLTLKDMPASSPARHGLEYHAVLWHLCLGARGVSFGSNKAWRYMTSSVPLFHRTIVAQEAQLLTRVADGPPGPVFHVSRETSLILLGALAESFSKASSRELGWQSTMAALERLRSSVDQHEDQRLAFVGWDPED